MVKQRGFVLSVDNIRGLGTIKSWNGHNSYFKVTEVQSKIKVGTRVEFDLRDHLDTEAKNIKYINQ